MRSHIDRAEAERLVETYSDLILRLSYTYLKSTEDAKDICQTVFLRLLEKPRKFESPEHERAYILRMAANACKDLFEKSVAQADLRPGGVRGSAGAAGGRRKCAFGGQ